MTLNEVQEIQEKIDSLKKRKSRAEGAMENIEKQWNQDYKISTIEEAKEKIKGLDIEGQELDTRIENLEKKINEFCDWDEVDV